MLKTKTCFEYLPLN